jgi:hypothetical protein
MCALDDAITVSAVGPGLWRYECANVRGHPTRETWIWQGTATDTVDEEATGGKMGELGLYEDLPRCLVTGEPYVEYGVVEYRYCTLRPNVYAQLIQDYSHTRLGPKEYTASAFIASALGRLADRGEVLYQEDKATGYWSYNGILSYWALPPGPEESGARLTYKEFAIGKGLDPYA